MALGSFRIQMRRGSSRSRARRFRRRRRAEVEHPAVLRDRDPARGGPLAVGLPRADDALFQRGIDQDRRRRAAAVMCYNTIADV